MGSKLLEILSREKPALTERSDITEAVRMGYSEEQIVKALLVASDNPVKRSGYIEYSRHLIFNGGVHDCTQTLKLPYTFESFALIQEIMRQNIYLQPCCPTI